MSEKCSICGADDVMLRHKGADYVLACPRCQIVFCLACGECKVDLDGIEIDSIRCPQCKNREVRAMKKGGLSHDEPRNSSTP
jgi:hypothetical protein